MPPSRSDAATARRRPLVLVAHGSRDPRAARSTWALARAAGAGSRGRSAGGTGDLGAQALGDGAGVPCVAGYASGGGRDTAEAVREVRAQGGVRVAVASYFLAPGLLYDRAVDAALAAGALVAAAPLGDAPEIAELVLARANTA